jgi:hypothetical protein
MEHKLKTSLGVFTDVKRGRKTFEYRRDDRGFAVGDTLVLKEWGKGCGYTGESVKAKVTYLLRGPAFGVPEGYVIMSIFVIGLSQGAEQNGS